MPYFGAIVLVIWMAALIDVIVSDEYRVRHLPKVGWLIIVILIPLAGSLIWFLVGRPEGTAPAAARPQRTSGYPEYERPGWIEARNAADDAAFRRQVRERAEEQRRKARERDDDQSEGDPDRR